MSTGCPKIVFTLLAFGLIAIAPLPTTAQEINVAENLNGQLLAKPRVKHSRTIRVQEERCTHAGSRFNGVDHCWTITREEVQRYEDVARVTSTEVLSIRDLVLDEPRLVTLPERALLSSADYENCADVQLSTTLSLSVSGTKGFSVQKGRTLTTTKGASVTLTGTFTGGSLSTALNVSESISLSASTTESSSTTVSRSTTSRDCSNGETGHRDRDVILPHRGGQDYRNVG